MSDNSISLYFGLAEDEPADLEIISQAAIAWVETLRAIAQATEPDTDVRVRLLSVDHSSAIYNTLIDWFDRKVEPQLDRIAKGDEKAPKTKKLITGIALFSITTIVPTYNEYFGDDFSDDDRDRIKRIEEQTRSNPSVETARRKFYRVIEREPRIKQIAIREEPNGESVVVINNDQFPQESGVFAIEEDAKERITRPVLEVVLVKPALVHTPRAWTFKPDGLPEFEAVMRDGIVLQAIKDRGFPAAMKEGVRMTVRLEVKEVQVDGSWKLVRGGRSVMRVISPKLD